MTQENGTQGLDQELELGKWQRLNSTQDSVTPSQPPIPSQDPCSFVCPALFHSICGQAWSTYTQFTLPQLL